MIIADRIETDEVSVKKGVYESFYFRGNDTSGNYSFWLKHNFLILKGDANVSIECILIVFNKTKKETKSWKVSNQITIDEFNILKEASAGKWEKLEYTFPNNSNFLISNTQLIGKISTQDDEVQWNFIIEKSGVKFYHFSQNKFYLWPFPKKKILTNDTDILFKGSITSVGFDYDGPYVGMNGHNWGTEHAYKYQYANCNQFEKHNAYFDGFSAKIILGGYFKSPYLSVCALRVNQVWHYFNDVKASYRHKVKRLEEKSWEATFENSTHFLKVKISDVDDNPWIHLAYQHPSGKWSQVNNTKYAKGTLILIQKKENIIIEQLESQFFELESLMPKT